MRIEMDPVPLVLGIYAQVGGLLNGAAERTRDQEAEELGRRFGAGGESARKDVKRLVKAVHADVKTSDKLLKKTGDVWKLAGETRVTLVVHRRGEGEDPRSYVLLRPDDVRGLLRAIRDAVEAAGGSSDVVKEIAAAADGVTGRPSDYYTFGFDPAD